MLKTDLKKKTLPAAEKTQFLSSFWSVSAWQPVPEGGRSYCGITLCLSAFCWRSHRTHSCLVCAGRRSVEPRGGLYDETSSGRHCGAVSCSHWYVKERIMYLIRLEIVSQRWSYQNSFWSPHVQQQPGSCVDDLVV